MDRTAASERPPHVILLIFLLLYALTFISVYCSRSYMLISYSITITGSPEVAFTIQNLDNNARVYKTALRLVGKGRREVPTGEACGSSRRGERRGRVGLSRTLQRSVGW